jgi:hypothetical protein
MNTGPLLLLNIRLESLPEQGDPFLSITNHIAGYFPDDPDNNGLYTFNLAISIKHDEPDELQKHRKRLAKFVKELNQCVSG